MSDVDDRWFRTDKETGEKVPTARHGRGLQYAARWRDPSGQQKSKSFARARDARAWLAKIEHDKNRGEYVDHLAGRIKLTDYVEQWLAIQTSNVSSQYQVELRLRTHVLPHFGSHELRAIKPAALQAWMRGLQGQIANNYVRTIAANFSAVLQAAVADELLAKNPFAAQNVKAPAKEQRKVVPWQEAWVSGMRDALPARYAELVTVAAGLGLRQGECLGLAVEDVDFLRGVVHVRRQVKLLGGVKFYGLPKRDKTRDVPLPTSVAVRLAKHLETAPRSRIVLPFGTPTGRAMEAALIFRTANGEAVNRQTFSDHAWATARKAAGVPTGRENGMHALRHYFASVVLSGGATIRDLADWLGHEDPGFTLRVYSHLMPDSADRMRDAIDRAFEGSAGALAERTV